jgi:hypothetical protein
MTHGPHFWNIHRYLYTVMFPAYVHALLELFFVLQFVVFCVLTVV